MSPQHTRVVKLVTAAAVIASVLACLVPVIAALMERLSGRLADFHWTALGVAFVLALVYWPVNAYVWNMVLKALGHSLPGGTAVRIWLAAQSCRWLPGGVWHYGSRTLQAVSHGIPSTVAVASMALELLLTIGAWAFLGVAGIAWYGQRQLHLNDLVSSRSIMLTLGASVALLLMLAAGFLWWRWFPRKQQALRERFNSLRLVRPRIVPTLMCFAVYVALSILNGLAFYAVVYSVSPDGKVPLLAALSANALAWIVGLFAVMAPGGLVVREAALVLQLSLWIPPAEAVLVAILWRLVQLAVEIVCVAAALVPQSVAARLARRRSAHDAAVPWAGPAALETSQPPTHP